MPEVSFVGANAFDRDNKTSDTSRLVNLYAEKTANEEWTLKSVLGSTLHVKLSGVFVREMIEDSGNMYILADAKLRRINEAGEVATLGALEDGDEQTICTNNGRICTATGGVYRVLKDGVWLFPTGGAFSAVGSVDFFGYYTVQTELGGRRIQWSALAAPETQNGLHFATADAKDDLILRGITLGNVYAVFKQKNIELWALTGGAGANALARVTGGVRDVGLAGFNLISRIPSASNGQAAFVGSDRRFYIYSGGSLTAVSTSNVETALQYGDPVAVFPYEDEGHTFACIAFNDGPAWCYDMQTGLWHERAEGPAYGPWKARRAVKVRGKWYVARDGVDIVELGRVNRDEMGPLYRMATSTKLTVDHRPFTVRLLELFPLTGFTDNGEIRLSVSRDGGAIFGTDKPRPVRPIGSYGVNPIWRNLGRSRSFVAKIVMTSRDEIPLRNRARLEIQQ